MSVSSSDQSCHPVSLSGVLSGGILNVFCVKFGNNNNNWHLPTIPRVGLASVIVVSQLLMSVADLIMLFPHLLLLAP